MSEHTDLIERLAREAGFKVQGTVTLDLGTGKQGEGREYEIMSIAPQEALQRFAALVAEECAKVVEPDAMSTIAEGVIGASRAAAIRAKFPKP